QDIDFRPGHRRHETLHERAVRLVDQPLRLRGDGAEHQRRLPRSRDTCEHREPTLGDLDTDVLEVVDARALDTNQIVAIRLRRAVTWFAASAGQVRSLRRAVTWFAASAGQVASVSAGWVHDGRSCQQTALS